MGSKSFSENIFAVFQIDIKSVFCSIYYISRLQLGTNIQLHVFSVNNIHPYKCLLRLNKR